MKEHSLNDSDNQELKKDGREPNKNELIGDDISLEEMEKELAERDHLIVQLKNEIQDSKERIHEVIIEKGSFEKQVKEFELKELSLQFSNFEQLKNDYDRLEHRLTVTKNQLDDAREKIKSQNEFVDKAKEQVEFMEIVIEDLKNRGLIDLLRNRFPESFVKYSKK